MHNTTNPYPSPPRPRARPAPKPQGVLPDPDGRLRQRIQATAHRALDAAALIVDRIAAPPPPPDRLTVAAHRRQFANAIRAARFCARNTCRRSGACRGEPSECLRAVLPLMPDVLVGVLGMRRRKRGESASSG